MSMEIHTPAPAVNYDYKLLLSALANHAIHCTGNLTNYDWLPLTVPIPDPSCQAAVVVHDSPTARAERIK